MKQDQAELKSLVSMNHDELEDFIMNLLPSNVGNTTLEQSPSSRSNPPPNFLNTTKPPPFIPTGFLRIANQLPPYTPEPIFAYLLRGKLELYKFDGNEKHCVAWFNNIEEYFDIYNIGRDEEKVKHASSHLEGDTYNW